MPNGFLATFFQSTSAQQLFVLTKSLFPTGFWIPTPMTGPELAKKGLLGDWWNGYASKLIGLIDSQDQVIFNEYSKSIVNLLNMLDVNNKSTPYPKDATRDDISKSVLTHLEGFQIALKKLTGWAELRKNSDFSRALTDFTTASFSASMGIVADLEYIERLGTEKPDSSLNETFNQLFARDRAAVLYELVGDPPTELLYGDTQTPDRYASVATDGLSLIINDPTAAGPDKTTDAVSEFQHWMNSFASADPSNETYKSQRIGSVLRLAIIAQEVGQEAIRSAKASDENTATRAAALASVMAEGMRGVLGMQVRGKGELDLSKTQEYEKVLLDFGSKKAEEIKENALDDPDNPPDPNENGDAGLLSGRLEDLVM